MQGERAAALYRPGQRQAHARQEPPVRPDRLHPQPAAPCARRPRALRERAGEAGPGRGGLVQGARQ